METKTIKDIDSRSWAEFKGIAARSRMTMGKLFEHMLHFYERESGDVWEKILHGEKILTDKEASDMIESVKKNRKEYGFR